TSATIDKNGARRASLVVDSGPSDRRDPVADHGRRLEVERAGLQPRFLAEQGRAHRIRADRAKSSLLRDAFDMDEFSRPGGAAVSVRRFARYVARMDDGNCQFTLCC